MIRTGRQCASLACVALAWGALLPSLVEAATPEGTQPAEPQTIDVTRLRLLDVAGGRHVLGETENRAGAAFVFMSPECPISRQYVPELNRLAQVVPGDKLSFYGVMSDPSLTRQAAKEFVDEFQVAFPVLFDASSELAALFNPRRVPEAFLLTTKGELVYRGRIDDLYAEVDKRRPAATQQDLLAAMTALVEGREVEVPRTQAVGCLFEAPKTSNDAQVTYARDIAPILFANCAECHRPGEVAPFSLLSYDDAAKRAEFIHEVTSNRLMPPWKAEEGHGDFFGARRLSERQIELIAAWAKAGAPEGNATELPPQPQFADGWRMGEPDVIVEAPVPFSIPADGADIFQHYVVPIDHDQDEMVVGFEFRPGNPAIVHHALIFLDSRGMARERDAMTPEPGWTSSGSVDASVTSMLGVWTPGMTPRFFPNNTGIPLEKGTDLVVQLHLHPSGKAESDQSKIGLYFAKQPVKSTMSRNPLLFGSLIIDIPPGESRYRASASVVLPGEVTLTSVFPHMHLIAREMKITATLPDGNEQSLIWIKNWNFYWQDAYAYAEPVTLPEGTRVEIEAYFDNSAENPANPSSPPRPVRFGNGSTDEMCFAIFQTLDDDRGARRRIGRATMDRFFEDFIKADLSPEARTYIVVEAIKLFGGGGRELRSLLLPGGGNQPQKAPEGGAETSAGSDGSN